MGRKRRMKHLLTAMIISSFISSSGVAYGFQSSNPAAASAAVSSSGLNESSAYALKLLEAMNKDGGYGRDLYRNTFMQIMGLVFLTPTRPTSVSVRKMC